MLQSLNTGVALAFDYGRRHASPTPTSARQPATSSATIDWGDGSPNSVGLVVSPVRPARSTSSAGHTYAKPGTYTVTRSTSWTTAARRSTLIGHVHRHRSARHRRDQELHRGRGPEHRLVRAGDLRRPQHPGDRRRRPCRARRRRLGRRYAGRRGRQARQSSRSASIRPTAEPIFEVLGSHTYAEETPPGLPDTLSVIITTLGGATTTLTSPPGGGVTVLDAKLTGSNGTAITGIEGIATGTVLLGTFIDANQGATVADFTAGTGGSVVVDWGDGSRPADLDCRQPHHHRLAQRRDLSSFTAAHTYAEEGTYAYTVTVTDDGGAVTVVSGSAIIADAPLTPSAPSRRSPPPRRALFPIPVFGTRSASSDPGLQRARSPRSPTPTPHGAASPTSRPRSTGATAPRMTAGTISQPGGAGTAFIVSGSHTYADAGVNGGAGTYPSRCSSWTTAVPG